MFVAWSTCNCIIAHVVDTHIVSLTLLPECLSLCGVQWHSTPADILHVPDYCSQTTWPPYSPYCTSVNRTCCESSLWVCRDCSLRECAMTLWSSGVCRYCRLRECGATIVCESVPRLTSFKWRQFVREPDVPWLSSFKCSRPSAVAVCILSIN